MKKSTSLNSDLSESLNHLNLILYEKPLPKTAKKQSIDNIIAFSRSYSVRKSATLGQIDFILN